MRIVIASDHGGFELKETIKQAFLTSGHEFVDVGCTSVESVDYPDYAEKAVELIASERCQRGILICGTGIGMSIAANRHRFIRAAVCHDAYTTRMSREHNDANVLCLGARGMEPELALEIVGIWLATEFTGGRHLTRIAKFSQ